MKTLLLAAAVAAHPVLADTITVQKDLPVAGRLAATATVFSAPLQKARVEVIPALQLRSGNVGSQEIAVSVRDLTANQSRYKAQIRRGANTDYLLVNGGFSSEQVDRASGLLMAGGRVLSIPSYSRVKGEAASTCEFQRQDRFRLSAQLCTDKAGQVKLGPFVGRGFESCTSAIQAGPVLAERGKVAVCESSSRDTPNVRTAMCSTSGGELKVVVTQAPMLLHQLATWMALAPDKGGLGCETAINLGGADSSGAALFLRSARGYPDVPAVRVGEGTYPQASFIAISVQ